MTQVSELPHEHVGTNSDLAPLTEAMLGTATGDMAALGGAEDLSQLVGQRAIVQVDIGRAVNDVAFWIGTPPNLLLVALDRDTRNGLERQVGLPSDSELAPPPTGIVTLGGVVTELPYAEAMYSWGLTRRDVAMLAERGAYVRIDEILSSAPTGPGEHAPARVNEWNRETAPPPGEREVIQPPVVVPAPGP